MVPNGFCFYFGPEAKVYRRLRRGDGDYIELERDPGTWLGFGRVHCQGIYGLRVAMQCRGVLTVLFEKSPVMTAHSCRWPTGQDAAVAARIAVVRCDGEMKGLGN